MSQENPIQPTSTVVASSSEGPLRYRDAYQALQSEIAAVTPSDLVAINLDIPAAAVTVLGCGPKLRSHRDAIAAKLPAQDLASFDKLETYALAAAHAHTLYLTASSPPEAIPELVDELTKARDLLVTDVTALAKRKLLDGSRLDELQGTSGYKNIAFDVMLLATLMREHWASIEGKTAVQLAELDRAEQIADRLAMAIGLREQEPGAANAAGETRQRAFSLFMKAYDQARRAITYLRWDEGDADTIAPSLYAGRDRSRRKAEATPAAPEPPVPNRAVAPQPTQAATTSTADNASAQGIAHSNGNGMTGPGMPGNDPFGH